MLELPAGRESRTLALTLDACGGGFDENLIRFLVTNRIAATVFVTKTWVDRHPAGAAMLKNNADLFEIENHGARHRAPLIGPDRQVFGVAGVTGPAQLKQEVEAGAAAVQRLTGSRPRWYRGATGEYDPAALEAIAGMGFRIAGFSLNADEGASLPRQSIVSRLKRARDGDIIIAHMNKPSSETAEGLAEGLRFLIDEGFEFVQLGARAVRPLGATSRPK
jgi:peptidoglycan/xylan/chitin deacetylase (PgdA/CDA1 family)